MIEPTQCVHVKVKEPYKSYWRGDFYAKPFHYGHDMERIPFKN